MKSYKVHLILLCAGSSSRTEQNRNKVLCYFGAKTAIEMCLDAFAPFVDNITIVAKEQDKEEILERTSEFVVNIVPGGKTRGQSVVSGLNLCGAKSGDIVIIHDGARPFVTADTINSCIESAITYGSGIAAVPAIDSMKEVRGGIIETNIDRNCLYNIQTPQAFKYDEISLAYNSTDTECTDDSEVYRRAGFEPRIVIGSYDNRKITTYSDLIATPPCQTIGTGYDVHPLIRGRKLVLGGVTIPYVKGLSGHSDADVLTHAIMDALLSAIGEPDIGVIFPCNDENKDANSIQLLKEVMRKVNQKNRVVAHISGVIIAQAPHLAPHIPNIRQTLASAMNIDLSSINISATTTERLGIVGKGKAMAASAVALMF